MDSNDSQDLPPPGGRALAALGANRGPYNLRGRGPPGDVSQPVHPAGGNVVEEENKDNVAMEQDETGPSSAVSPTMSGNGTGPTAHGFGDDPMSPTMSDNGTGPTAHGFGDDPTTRSTRAVSPEADDLHVRVDYTPRPMRISVANDDLLATLTASSTAASGSLSVETQAAVQRYAQTLMAGIRGFVYSGFEDIAPAAAIFRDCCFQEWLRLTAAAGRGHPVGHPTSLLHAIQDSLEQQRPPSMPVDAFVVAYGYLLAYRHGPFTCATVLFRSSVDAPAPPSFWLDPRTAPAAWRDRAQRSSRDATLGQKDLETRQKIMGDLASQLGPYSGETTHKLFNRQRTPTLWLGYYRSFLKALTAYSVDSSSTIATVLLVKCLQGEALSRYKMLKNQARQDLTHADIHSDFQRHYGKDATLRIIREYAADTLTESEPDVFFEYWDRLYSLSRL